MLLRTFSHLQLYYIVLSGRIKDTEESFSQLPAREASCKQLIHFKCKASLEGDRQLLHQIPHAEPLTFPVWTHLWVKHNDNFVNIINDLNYLRGRK